MVEGSGFKPHCRTGSYAGLRLGAEDIDMPDVLGQNAWLVILPMPLTIIHTQSKTQLSPLSVFQQHFAHATRRSRSLFYRTTHHKLCHLA